MCGCVCFFIIIVKIGHWLFLFFFGTEYRARMKNVQSVSMLIKHKLVLPLIARVSAMIRSKSDVENANESEILRKNSCIKHCMVR